MRQSRSTPALSVCLQDFSSPPGSVGIFRSRCDTHTHASRAPEDDEDAPDHRSRAADRVIAAAARDSSRYMSSARSGDI